MVTTPLTWACLECDETVTDLDEHTLKAHESEVVEVFTSRHALERVLAEEQSRAALKIPTGDPHE